MSALREAVNAGGAYGLRLSGVEDDLGLLVDAPPHWRHFEISVRVGTTPPVADWAGDTRAVLRLPSGGAVTIDREPGRAVFDLPAPPRDGALVHPHLAAAAVVIANWLGRESFHAGGFVAGDGVWGVLGDKGAGKSSALTALALAGVPVMCDDVLVVERQTAFAGPRSIDLRPDAASWFGLGEPLGVLGSRERWRVTTTGAAPELPLRGWVLLGWGPAAVTRELRGSARLQTLLAHRSSRLPLSDPAGLIELSALPFLEFRRPRRWQSLPQATERLRDAIGC